MSNTCNTYKFIYLFIFIYFYFINLDSSLYRLTTIKNRLLANTHAVVAFAIGITISSSFLI